MKLDELAGRIRSMLSPHPGYSEKNMFGGVCFMIYGNMCVGTWKGSLIVRLERKKHEEALAEPHTKPADIAGRIMKGWALVKPSGIVSKDALETWVAAPPITRLPCRRSSRMEAASDQPMDVCRLALRRIAGMALADANRLLPNPPKAI